jgi:hypothetical protein
MAFKASVIQPGNDSDKPEPENFLNFLDELNYRVTKLERNFSSLQKALAQKKVKVRK